MAKKQANKSSPRTLFLDVETKPLTVYTWGLFDQNIGLNQILDDWCILSFAAKWSDSKQMFYADQSKGINKANEKKMLQQLWLLLDESDLVIGQNVKAFDKKKINARFLEHEMPPPSSYRLIDTLSIMRRNFALTSNKLEYASKFNKKYKKLSHPKFSGFSLWSECMKGNKAAWKEMRKYNCYDVYAVEELYNRLSAWDTSINFDAYHDDLNHKCACGHTEFINKGYAYTSTGKFNRYLCKSCNRESRGKENLLSREKRKSMRR